jgi:DNA-directed RNA polymerase specialized sigma subunit
MNITNKDIAAKLRQFPELERKQKQLLFELKHGVNSIAGEDVIEAMTFSNGVSGGISSNPIPVIADTYAKMAKSINSGYLKELQDELAKVNLEIARLTYYSGLLNTAHTAVITLHYFEGKTVSETASAVSLSETSVKYLLRSAVKELVNMFKFILPMGEPDPD